MHASSAFFLILTIVTVSHQSREFDDVITKYKGIVDPVTASCLAESGMEPRLIQDLINKGEYPQDRKLKCYLRCVYLKLKMLNERAEINEQQVKKNVGVDDEKIKDEVYHRCKNVKGADLCEVAFNLSKCTYRTVEELVKKH